MSGPPLNRQTAAPVRDDGRDVRADEVPSLNRQRALPFREHRHYFRRKTWVGAWKVRLAVLALLVTVGVVAARMINPDRRYAVCTHGEVARAHGIVADQCQACHEPFDDKQPAGLFDTHDRWRAFDCKACHRGPDGEPKNYAPHYTRATNPNLTADAFTQALDCGRCHHDHKGADANLRRVSDAECVRCHKDLSPLHGTGPSVTAFHDGHPEFAVKTTDGAAKPDRAIKFNHALHLAAGLIEPGNQGNLNAQWTLGKIDEKFRAQYAAYAPGGGENAAVHLDCAACHEPAGGGFRSVAFNRHCQGCHADALTASAVANVAGVNTKSFVVPHGQPKSEVERFVRGELLRQVTEKTQLTAPAPAPSERLDPRARPAVEKLGQEVERVVPQATASVNCQKCHNLTAGDEIVRPRAQTLWLPKAQFDHASHKAVQCAHCHANGNPGDIRRQLAAEPLDVPGIDTCRVCHAPAGFRPTVDPGRTQKLLDDLHMLEPGGVRHDCTDCHRYHHSGQK